MSNAVIRKKLYQKADQIAAWKEKLYNTRTKAAREEIQDVINLLEDDKHELELALERVR